LPRRIRFTELPDDGRTIASSSLDDSCTSFQGVAHTGVLSRARAPIHADHPPPESSRQSAVDRSHLLRSSFSASRHGVQSGDSRIPGPANSHQFRNSWAAGRLKHGTREVAPPLSPASCHHQV